MEIPTGLGPFVAQGHTPQVMSVVHVCVCVQPYIGQSTLQGQGALQCRLQWSQAAHRQLHPAAKVTALHLHTTTTRGGQNPFRLSITLFTYLLF